MEIIFLLTIFAISVVANLIGRYMPLLAIEELTGAKKHAKEIQPMLLGIALALLFRPYTELWFLLVVLFYPFMILLTKQKFQFHIPIILTLSILTMTLEGIILAVIANYTHGLQQTNFVRNINLHLLIITITILYLII